MEEIIVGMREFEERLKALELFARRGALIAACKAGAEIVKEAASSNAPRGHTGKLAGEMTVTVRQVSDFNEATVDVGPSKKAWYGMFSEFGTKFMGPRPFLGPALEANRDRIEAVMKAAILEALEALVKAA